MLEIKGYSNSNICLFEKDDKFLIKKSGNNKERLERQKIKQQQFINKIQKNILMKQLFSSPTIIEGDDFIMEFCEGDSVLDIIEYRKTDVISDFLEKLEIFLTWEFNNAFIQKIDKSILINKLSEIFTEYPRKIEIIDKINKIENICIPIGFCHGDFTFSNMIFSNKIILIDFLDSYIESPVQDLAKLLQEINLYWTINMSIVSRDLTKLKIGYEYIKTKTNAMIKKLCNIYKIDYKILKIFYIIVLFRIFPYIKDKIIYELLTKELDKQISII